MCYSVWVTDTSVWATTWSATNVSVIDPVTNHDDRFHPCGPRADDVVTRRRQDLGGWRRLATQLPTRLTLTPKGVGLMNQRRHYNGRRIDVSTVLQLAQGGQRLLI